MSERWTKNELDDIQDIEFAICILNERKAGLNYYSPLSLKIKQTVKTLEGLKEDA